MIYSKRLSLMSAYCIRKILIKYQDEYNKNFGVAEAQIDLEQILSDLYIEKISIENRIHNLETLVRMHQVLSIQKTVDSLHDVELQIYNIFGFKSGSD